MLLAEDNEINRELAVASLEHLGLDVAVAIDGVEALEACQRERFDLLLTDVQMPGLDGYELCRRIRERERDQQAAARLPIIASTAGATDEERERCLAAGMDDHLAKPFGLDQLAGMLGRWLPAAGTSPSRRIGT